MIVAQTYLSAQRLPTRQVSLSKEMVPSGVTRRMKCTRPAVMGRLSGSCAIWCWVKR